MVEQLKDAIEFEIRLSLKMFEARDLTLYKIDLDGSDEAECMKQAKYLAKNPDSLLKPEPPKRLTTVFGPSGPIEEKIHILVVPPPGEPINSRVTHPPPCSVNTHPCSTTQGSK